MAHRVHMVPVEEAQAPRSGGVIRLRRPVRTRRVLMICCAFPPTGGPGVQRSAKFAKYLPHWGWKPYVWAADRLRDLPEDASLLDDLPADLTVRRAASGDPRDVLERWCGRLPWRLERGLLLLLKRLPLDPQVLWALRSVKACRRLIRAARIDVIYSTYSPPSNHLLAWLLHRATGKPWVADFRDLWTADYCYPHRGLRRRIDAAWERRFVTAADAVIGVSTSQTVLLSELAPGCRDRFHTITNGVDTADFAGIDPVAARQAWHGPADRFLLVFSGTFHSDRVADGFLAGLKAFAANEDARRDFALRVVGRMSQAMEKALRATGLNVEATGYVSHRQAIEHLLAADALLLLGPGGPNGATLLPAKSFEYLAAGRPVLAVTPSAGAEATQIIERCEAGVCVRPEPAAVADALTGLWTAWRAGTLPAGCAPCQLALYTRKHLAGQLAEVLESVLKDRP
jgi:glycosyltransferase involved in cell wall biosynthesis